MWVRPDEVEPILRRPWWTTPFTESNMHYAMYDDRFNVDIYTLRFNLWDRPDFEEEHMLDLLIQKVMNRFPRAESVVGKIDYDRLLTSPSQEERSYYIFQANSNQRQSDHIIENTFALDQHNLYFFGKKALAFDLSVLSDEFMQRSNVIIHSILAIVFTFCPV
jgi:hypothetical protein